MCAQAGHRLPCEVHHIPPVSLPISLPYRWEYAFPAGLRHSTFLPPPADLPKPLRPAQWGFPRGWRSTAAPPTLAMTGRKVWVLGSGGTGKRNVCLLSPVDSPLLLLGLLTPQLGPATPEPAEGCLHP